MVESAKKLGNTFLTHIQQVFSETQELLKKVDWQRVLQSASFFKTHGKTILLRIIFNYFCANENAISQTTVASLKLLFARLNLLNVGFNGEQPPILV